MGGSRLGAVLVLASTVPFALSGVFTKLIGADLWTVLGWRGVIGSVLTFAYVELTRPKGPRASFGWRGWLLASVGTCASIAFLGSFRLTYVANVALIYAMTPFAAAAFGCGHDQHSGAGRGGLGKISRASRFRVALLWKSRGPGKPKNGAY